MKILAVDTSTSVAAVAVMDELTLLGEYFINQKKTHSQKFMPMIEEIMKGLELKPCDIDLFAVSSGPGSFTGLRIGITAIKTMAYALNKPVIGIPTLDALAYNIFMGDYLVCPIMDARNNQVYTSFYKWENRKLKRISDYMGIEIKEVVNISKSYNQKVVFIGDGLSIHKEFLEDSLKENFLLPQSLLLLQRASSVAELAYFKAMDGEFENSFDLTPFYLRKCQAEREFENRK